MPQSPTSDRRQTSWHAWLLPSYRGLGWTPFAWLVNLPILFVEPVLRGASATEWALTGAAIVLFLGTYFRAYWVRGRALLGVVAVQVALGAVLTPLNAGAVVFFVYAAAFAGQLDSRRSAVAGVAMITAVGLLAAWWASVPPYYWAVAGIFVPLLGGVNFHFVQVERANARLRLAQVEVERLAATAERERIARDLHDVLGHTLSLVVLKAQLAARLAEHDAARAAGEMRDVEGVARAALSSVRETIRGYQARLSAELANARTLLETAGVEVELSSATLPLDVPREEALALALREAATNVVRHAHARRCRIRLREAQGAAILEIEDDGAHPGERRRDAPDGPVPDWTPTEGSGLRGMRERVEALGGTATWHAGRESRGLRLTVRLPLEDGDGPAPPRGIDATPSVHEAARRRRAAVRPGS